MDADEMNTWRQATRNGFRAISSKDAAEFEQMFTPLSASSPAALVSLEDLTSARLAVAADSGGDVAGAAGVSVADGAGAADGKPSPTGRKPPPEDVTGKRDTVFKQFRALIDGPSVLTKLVGDAETAAAAVAKYTENKHCLKSF